ncbi:hypothetical protein GCM10011581_07530 [Saccharopolyspora subtropica]|uniref:Uncharacterized protein n=1 Tax=Saccharopolyspora thermophila TaxID=89367 RepID=A0A917JKH1_9PSEU|nr:DUF6461 domain-containing protein [Saccharopolyspora subtropica]GGI73079.1 hypothetical protein GCM10011581_07530 [Saccharopolyspora subtropica]
MGSYCVRDEVERASWIRRSIIQEAACLTFVRGASLTRIAEAFGAVTERCCPLDIEDFCEEAFARQEKHPMVALRSVGDWVLVVEDSGRQGQRPEVLRRAGRCAAVSAFWDANALTRFSYAAHGAVRTTFEAVLPEYREGTAPDELEGVRAGLPWREADPVPLMLALAGRITRLSPDPDWLAGQFHTFPVAPWPDDLVAVPDPMDALTGYPAALASALRGATDAGRRRAATAVARHVLTAADCLAHPAARSALTALDTGHPVDGCALGEAVRQLAWESTLQRPASKVRNQLRAVEALRQATREDPLTALVTTLAEARHVRGVDVGELTRITTAELAG